MAGRQIDIDRAKLRTAIRKLGDEYVFYMLDDAIDQLPPAKLHKIVRKYLDLRRLRPDSQKARKATLLAEVRAFETASLAGEYYESFDVNSKNFMEKSKGTTGWIAECRRLLDRCVEQAKTANPAEVCQAFDIIFGLLDRIDECRRQHLLPVEPDLPGPAKLRHATRQGKIRDDISNGARCRADAVRRTPRRSTDSTVVSHPSG